MPVEAFASAASARMTDGQERYERKKKSEAKRRQTQFAFCRGFGHGRASQRRGAHLSAFHRGSRPKESFIARDSAPGFSFLGRGGRVGGPSVGRALPASTYPSPAMPSQPGRSARRITPDAARARVASPPGTALARAIRGLPPGPRPTGRDSNICNIIGDGRQWRSDTKIRHPEVRAAQPRASKDERPKRLGRRPSRLASLAPQGDGPSVA